MPRALLPLVLLLAYAAAFAVRALGGGVLAYDDHPGQLYRAWHVIVDGWAPWAWSPGWWAGYPELQFYPPLQAWLVALLHVGSGGVLSIGVAYQAWLWVAYAAPGVAVYALLARRLGDGAAALPGAFIALALSAGLASGVEGGVHIGMASARLAWALLALLPLALDRWTDEDAASLPRARVALLLAAIALCHPAQVPTAVAALGLAATARPPLGPRLRSAALALATGAALTAIWSLPLLARLADTRALAWGALDPRAPADRLVHEPLLAALIVLAAATPWLARARADRALARLPGTAAVLVAADYVLLEPFGVRWLPADRVADGAWLAVVIAAGLAIGRLLQRLPGTTRPVGALACILLVAALGAVGGALTLWPRRAEWPTLAEIERGLRLDALWRELAREPEGRVLFVRSSVPLAAGAEWYRPHTHVTSLAPMLGGRAIVNGTFTHPAPLAALIYRGSAAGGAITSLVERLDGRTLLGSPLERLDAATLDRLADRLGVAVVVALDDDIPRLGRLLDATAPRTTVGPFLVIAREAVAVPRAVTRDRWRIDVDGRDGWTPLRVAYYPLWRAELAGRAVDTRRGEDGVLEARLAGRERVTVDLVYGRGAPETAGAAVTAAAILALVGAAIRRRN